MNYYETLGIGYSASAEEISKAYRHLSRANHPDRNIGDITAPKRFIEIQTAYETLSDLNRKSNYDLTIQKHIKLNKKQKIKEKTHTDNFKIYDAAPLNVDLWGQPIETKTQEFKDAFSKNYIDGDIPVIR